MTSRRLRIHGRVQGVFYRGWAVREAQSLGLSGWVRNRSDGSVELLAAGDAAALETLTERCREGPPAAQVTRIDVEETGETVSGPFGQRPTF